MTRERNPEATCGNCPGYNHSPYEGHEDYGQCRKKPEPINKQPDDWCMEHPDFWKEYVCSGCGARSTERMKPSSSHPELFICVECMSINVACAEEQSGEEEAG